MKRLTISLLGPLQVKLDGEPVIHFAADSARALLAFLVMNPDTPYRRQALSSLLWPDQPDVEALRNLRQALSRLRTAIGDREATPPFLHITQQTIQFNAASDYWLDAAEFTRLLDSGRGHQHGPQEVCRLCLEPLQRAAELYRGDLMAGFSLDSILFEEWLVVERERFHRQAIELFHRLANYFADQEKYPQVEYYARRQLELEPWCEEAHRQLIQALAFSGQRSAALAQYEACCHTLREELGIGPTEETKALYSRIKAEKLAAPSRPRHNLPLAMTPLIGREAELNQLVARLHNPAYRLITLVGEGGVGKTRLALAAAEQLLDEFAHGVWLVPLEKVAAEALPIAQPAATSLLLTAIAAVLQFSFTGQRDLQAQLLDYLHQKEMLLLLDSFEYLLTSLPPNSRSLPLARSSDVDLILAILQHAPKITLLITSRQRLNLQAEYVMPLKGLPIPPLPPAGTAWTPDTLAHLTSYSSLQLFAERAERTLPDFTVNESNLPDIVQVCRLVDGLPLGIEIAAAWIGQLSLAELARRIQEDLGFLATTMRDVPARHRSMSAVFESSWKLLSWQEQTALAQVSAFHGGFTLEAAQAVLNVAQPVSEKPPAAKADLGPRLPDLLRSLVNKSLLWNPVPERYEMHGLLRQYALEKLALDPETWRAVRNRHCAYYTALLARYTADLKGARQREGLEALSAEIANVRLAWQWAVTHAQVDRMKDALDSLFLFYYMGSWFQEGEDAFHLAVESLSENAQSADQTSQIVMAKAMACQGWFAFQLGHHGQARELLQESLARLRALDAPAEIAFCLNYLGAVALHLGSYAEARELCLEGLALSQKSNDYHSATIALNILGRVAHLLGDHTQARQYYQESLTLAMKTGNRWGIAFSLNYLGELAYARGEYDRAGYLFAESLAARREMGDRRGVALCLNSLGDVTLELGEHDKAQRFYQDGLATFREIGHQAGIVESLTGLGHVAAAQGNDQEAWGLFLEALQLAMAVQAEPGALDAVVGMAAVVARSGNLALALALLEQARHHPAIREKTRTRAERLWAELAPQVEAPIGAADRLEALISRILAEPPVFPAAPPPG